MEKYGSVRQTTGGSVIQRMCFACCISKGADTSSIYVILNAMPQHHWLCDHASVLHLYVHGLSCLNSVLSNKLYNFLYSCSIPNETVMNFCRAISLTSNAHQLIPENVWPLNCFCYP